MEKEFEVIHAPAQFPSLKRIEDCVCIQKWGKLVVAASYQAGATGCEDFIPQHVYITTKQNIKDGDLVIYKTDIWVIARYSSKIAWIKPGKIVACTDRSLSLPLIPMYWIMQSYIPGVNAGMDIHPELKKISKKQFDNPLATQSDEEWNNDDKILEVSYTGEVIISATHCNPFTDRAIQDEIPFGVKLEVDEPFETNRPKQWLLAEQMARIWFDDFEKETHMQGWSVGKFMPIAAAVLKNEQEMLSVLQQCCDYLENVDARSVNTISTTGSALHKKMRMALGLPEQHICKIG